MSRKEAAAKLAALNPEAIESRLARAGAEVLRLEAELERVRQALDAARKAEERAAEAERAALSVELKLAQLSDLAGSLPSGTADLADVDLELGRAERLARKLEAEHEAAEREFRSAYDEFGNLKRLRESAEER